MKILTVFLLVFAFAILTFTSFSAQGRAQEDAIQYLVRANDKILQTVYWALGSILVILLLIIGLGWYNNLRVYRKDLDSMRESVSVAIKERASEIEGRLNTQIEKRAKDVLQSSKVAVQESIAQLQKSIDSLKSDLLNIEWEIGNRAASDWLIRGQPITAAHRYCDLLNIAIQQGYDWRISDVLDSLRKTIKIAGNRVDSSLVVNITNILGKLPSKYGPEREGIQNLLSKIRGTL